MMKTLNRMALIASAIVGTTTFAQETAPETAPAPATTTSAAPTRYSGTADAPVAPSDRLDQGWNRDWSLNFSLNNPFTSSSVLSNFQGFVSGDYYLSDDSAVRVGLSVSRSHDPVVIEKVTVTNGPDTIVTYDLLNALPTYNDGYTVRARGEYLKRLSSGAVAPYVGGGLLIDWSWNRLSFLDEVTVTDQRVGYHNSATTFGIGVNGLVGAEWRVHSHFALFAEYGLGLLLFQSTTSRLETTVETTTGSVTTSSRAVRETGAISFLEFGSGLSQGGSLGLRVLF